MLALNANSVTTLDNLVDAVWDTAPPSTARGQIQTCISALRKSLATVDRPDAISRHEAGYLLAAAPGELDTEEFVTAVRSAKTESEAGQHERAAELLHAGLALWRGPALAGVRSDLVQRSAALLEERRLNALEERLRLDLMLGKHEEASGELQALLDEHPLRERLFELRIVSLYRAGRQAEALDVYRTARTRLIDELGIEPGRALQELEQAVLRRDTALDLPRSPEPTTVRATSSAAPAKVDQVNPRQVPRSIADFTGREQQIEEIKQLLSAEEAEASPFAVRIVAISGKGGVGKSSLAVRVAHELADVFPDGHLYADLRTLTTDNPIPTLHARFLRALGVSGPAIPDDPEERMELYRSRVSGKRLLLVLDDVLSESQVIPLLPGSPTSAVIVTSRTRLSGLSGAHLMDVDAFDLDMSIALIAKIIGQDRVAAEREATANLVRRCDHLPLALRIAGARLASRPHWRVNVLVQRLDDQTRRLDELSHRGLQLRSNIALTYGGLNSQAQRLFRLCALIDTPEFAGWTAAALLDADSFRAEDALENLVEARVLDTVEYPDGHVRYRLHKLIEDYARERLNDVESDEHRRAALARVLGGWLAFAEEHHRKEYGGDFTILHSVAPRWPADGTVSEMGADSPIDWWETERTALVAAIKQAAHAGFDDLCWDLAMTSITVFESKGYFDDWRETTELALALTQRAGNRIGEASMRYSLGTLHMYQKRATAAQDAFNAALEIFAEEKHDHGRALVLRNAAHIDWMNDDFAAMLGKYHESLALMRKVGDCMGEAHILGQLARFEAENGRTEDATELLHQALAICKTVTCLRGEAQVMHRFAHLYLRTSRLDQAREAFHRVLLIVRDIGDRVGEAHALHGLGVVRHQEGRLDSAETTLAHAHAVARSVGEQMVEAQVLLRLGEIAVAKAAYIVASDRLSQARQLFDELKSPKWRDKVESLLGEVDTIQDIAN